MIPSKSPEEVARQYLSVLLRAIRSLPNNTARSRGEMYQRAERAQKLSVAAASEPIEPEEAEFHVRLFRTVRNMLESDIRAGLDIFDADYYPDQLAEVAKRLAERRDLLLARKHAIAARKARLANATRAPAAGAPELRRAIDDMDSALAYMDAAKARLNRFFQGLVTFRALFILQVQLISSRSRLSLLWLFLQPVALLMLISAIYVILVMHTIMNMDVPSFALLGATTWIMIRRAMMYTAGSFRLCTPFINMPPIRPLSYALTQSTIFLLIYALVLATMILYVNLVGWSQPPHDPLMLIVYFFGMWLISFCLGVCSASIATFWPFFLQIASVLFGRALEIFSSVYFVSEQLPEAYKPFVLWSPTAHGMQLLRQAYFAGYVSTDASPGYFWSSVLCLMIATAVAVRISATRVEPA